MTISQNTIKPAIGAAKKRKRVGRGNASGHGTYSTRGLKGQKSRSGGKKGLNRMSIKKMLQHIPKNRGFKSDKPKNQVVEIASLNNKFKDGAKINPTGLEKAGLVDLTQGPVKLVGKSELKLKYLAFENVAMSGSVKEQVEKMGGRVIN